MTLLWFVLAAQSIHTMWGFVVGLLIIWFGMSLAAEDMHKLGVILTLVGLIMACISIGS